MKSRIAPFKSFRRLSFFDKANRDWERAWQMNLTPWDLKGTVAPPLVEAINSKIIADPSSKRALVPGCGSGYECIFLRQKGFSTVTGLDLSTTAIDAAKAQLMKQSVSDGIDFKVADFFTYKAESYDFIFDYLFFAALDPPLREKWANSMQRLLKPDHGILATLIFPLKQVGDDPTRGPPYPVSLEDYEQVLRKHQFELIKIEKNINSIRPRLGREIMAYWKLKSE